MTYFKLLDPKHENTIVRAEGRSQQQHIKGRGWVESGIMLHYFSDESDTYDEYEEISEDEALKIISQQ